MYVVCCRRRIRKGYPYEARVITQILPAFLMDFFPSQDVMNKVIAEFLSCQQPHPELMADVVFQVRMLSDAVMLDQISACIFFKQWISHYQCQLMSSFISGNKGSTGAGTIRHEGHESLHFRKVEHRVKVTLVSIHFRVPSVPLCAPPLSYSGGAQKEPHSER